MKGKNNEGARKRSIGTTDLSKRQSGAIQSVLDSFAEDIEWQIPEMENVPFSGIWQGRQKVGQFFGTLAETQEMVEFEPEEFIAQGDKVVVLGRFSMRVKSTGKDSQSNWAHIWTIKDSKVKSFREYVDTAAVSKAHTPAQSARQNR